MDELISDDNRNEDIWSALSPVMGPWYPAFTPSLVNRVLSGFFYTTLFVDVAGLIASLVFRLELSNDDPTFSMFMSALFKVFVVANPFLTLPKLYEAIYQLLRYHFADERQSSREFDFLHDFKLVPMRDIFSGEVPDFDKAENTKIYIRIIEESNVNLDLDLDLDLIYLDLKQKQHHFSISKQLLELDSEIDEKGLNEKLKCPEFKNKVVDFIIASESPNTKESTSESQQGKPYVFMGALTVTLGLCAISTFSIDKMASHTTENWFKSLCEDHLGITQSILPIVFNLPQVFTRYALNVMGGLGMLVTISNLFDEKPTKAGQQLKEALIKRIGLLYKNSNQLFEADDNTSVVELDHVLEENLLKGLSHNRPGDTGKDKWLTRGFLGAQAICVLGYAIAFGQAAMIAGRSEMHRGNYCDRLSTGFEAEKSIPIAIFDDVAALCNTVLRMVTVGILSWHELPKIMSLISYALRYSLLRYVCCDDTLEYQELEKTALGRDKLMIFAGVFIVIAGLSPFSTLSAQRIMADSIFATWPSFINVIIAVFAISPFHALSVFNVIDRFWHASQYRSLDENTEYRLLEKALLYFSDVNNLTLLGSAITRNGENFLVGNPSYEFYKSQRRAKDHEINEKIRQALKKIQQKLQEGYPDATLTADFIKFFAKLMSFALSNDFTESSSEDKDVNDGELSDGEPSYDSSPLSFVLKVFLSDTDSDSDLELGRSQHPKKEDKGKEKEGSEDEEDEEEMREYDQVSSFLGGAWQPTSPFSFGSPPKRVQDNDSEERDDRSLSQEDSASGSDDSFAEEENTQSPQGGRVRRIKDPSGEVISYIYEVGEEWMCIEKAELVTKNSKIRNNPKTYLDKNNLSSRNMSNFGTFSAADESKKEPYYQIKYKHMIVDESMLDQSNYLTESSQFLSEQQTLEKLYKLHTQEYTTKYIAAEKAQELEIIIYYKEKEGGGEEAYWASYTAGKNSPRLYSILEKIKVESWKTDDIITGVCMIQGRLAWVPDDSQPVNTSVFN